MAPAVARSRLARTPFRRCRIGDVDDSNLSQICSATTGFQVGLDGDVTVAVTDDYLRPALAAWNARSLASGKPWLLVKPMGMETWIGPLFVPGRTGCWECLAQRLRGHRKLERVSGAAQWASGSADSRPPRHRLDRARRPRRSSHGDHALDRMQEGNQRSSIGWCRQTSSRSNDLSTSSLVVRSARPAALRPGTSSFPGR